MSDEDESAETSRTTDEAGTENNAFLKKGKDNLNRRSFLNVVGTASASLFASKALSDNAAAKDPTIDVEDGAELSSVLDGITDGDTIVLPEGKYQLTSDVDINADDFTFDGNGSTIETHGRRHININGVGWDFGYVDFKPQNDSNPDSWCTVYPKGDQWRFHHCAWSKENKSRYVNGNNNRMGCILPGIKSGGDAEITDCWFGHGCDTDHGKSAIKTWGIMDGTLWIRRCYFYQMGVYGANSSTSKIYNEGVTNYESCYFENCYLACLRTGGHYDTAYIRNCVMNYSDVSEIPAREGIPSGVARGIFAYHGPVKVENTQFNVSMDRAIQISAKHDIRRQPTVHYKSGDYRGTIQNKEYATIESDVGNNPSTSPPDECITSASEAVQGSVASGDTGKDKSTLDTDHELVIEGTGTTTNYQFTVDGDLKPESDTIEPWDTVDGTTVEGWVTSEGVPDRFEFTGSVTDFSFLQGEATIYLDGKKISVDNL